MLLDEELFGRVKNVGAEMEGHRRSFLASQLMRLTSNIDANSSEKENAACIKSRWKRSSANFQAQQKVEKIILNALTKNKLDLLIYFV